MRLFQCQSCGQLLYFENTTCESCSHRLGYLPLAETLSALEPDGDLWQPLAAPNERYRFCANAQYDVCNWLVPADSANDYCLCCRHNQIVPDISVGNNLERWRNLEVGKHRLFYTLFQLKLPTPDREEDPQHGLAFEFLAEVPGGPQVLTGHDEGLIVLNLAEGDDAEREKMREGMGEYYRTILGHFRHEVGHYYWDVLIRDGGHLQAFRAMFGDDTKDYGEALKEHYANGAPANWQEHFVSTYASTHAWEDWAETWAHYLHIVDTLEMARSFGMEIHPRIDSSPEMQVDRIHAKPSEAESAAELLQDWLPLTFAVNSLNRSMGQPDLYPFVLSAEVMKKLGFVHDLVHGMLPVEAEPALQ